MHLTVAVRIAEGSQPKDIQRFLGVTRTRLRNLKQKFGVETFEQLAAACRGAGMQNEEAP